MSRDLDDYAQEYARGYIGFERVLVGYRRRKVLERLAAWPHRTILEAGCALEPLFLHATGWEQFCVAEPAHAFAENARAKATANVRVEELPLEALPPGERFQFVVLSSLLHEVEDPRALLAAAKAHCEPRGVVHVNVPNARSLHNLLGVEMGVIPDAFARSPLAQSLQRSRTFDLAALKAFAQAGGFEVVASGSYFLKPFTHAQMTRLLEEKIVDERVLDACYSITAKAFEDAGAEIFVDLRPL
jgi:SAM-dependent methyltransferase